MIVTQWFAGEEKPEWIGWYERRFPGGSAFWYFNGNFWCHGGHDKALPWTANKPAPSQNLEWRGLAEKP